MDLSAITLAGMSLFTLAAAAFAAIDTRGAFIHLRTEPWTNHAMFHAVTGLFYNQALCALVVFLTWVPYRQGEVWTWWLVLLIGIAIHGGHFLADRMTHGGLLGGGTAQGPGLIFYTGTGIALVMYLVGSGLTFQHFY